MEDLYVTIYYGNEFLCMAKVDDLEYVKELSDIVDSMHEVNNKSEVLELIKQKTEDSGIKIISNSFILSVEGD